MSDKSIEKVKSSLKLRTESSNSLLSVRSGVKKLSLPFEVRTLSSKEYMFIHVPPSAAIFKMTKEGLVEVTNAEEAKTAAKSFRKPRKSSKRTRKSSAVEMPSELTSALSMIPSGFKLGYDASGKPKLVKQRTRRKSK